MVDADLTPTRRWHPFDEAQTRLREVLRWASAQPNTKVETRQHLLVTVWWVSKIKYTEVRHGIWILTSREKKRTR